MTQPQDSGIYARAHAAVIEQLQYLGGKTFTTDSMCRWCGCQAGPEHKEYRNNIVKVLYNFTHINKVPLLKQIGNQYALIDRGLEIIDWWQNQADSPEMQITFPFSHDDNNYSSFDFESAFKLIPGDMFVIAGETNRGKTAFMLNLLVDNCKKYPMTYFSSEFNEFKFKERIGNFTWGDILDNGKPRFEVVRRSHDFEDAVAERKDNICIIDWIKLEDDLYKMGYLLGKIKDKIRNGMLFVALQKRTYKEVGEGGEGTLERADVYVTMSHGKLKLNRVKTPKLYDAEGKDYGFDLVNRGTMFHNIHEIKPCPYCHTKGTKAFGVKCENCSGSGYVDKAEG